MKHNCPKDSSHDKNLPRFVSLLQIHPAWSPVRFSRFRLCSDDIHVRNFENSYALRSDCAAERGRAWLWLRCEDRKVLVKVPSKRLCHYHVGRVSNAMRWIVNPAASMIRMPPGPDDDKDT